MESAPLPSAFLLRGGGGPRPAARRPPTEGIGAIHSGEEEGTNLERLHPLAKLLVTALVCVAAFLFRPWVVPAALAALAAILHRGVGGGRARLGTLLGTFPPFAAIIVLASAFLAGHPGPWWHGAAAGLVQSLRVLAMMLAASLFLASTDPVDLADALSRAVRPLERGRARTGGLALMTMLVASFAPLMIEEARRLELAQAVRCGFPRRGPAAVRWAAPLLAPLFAGVIRRADEIDLALRARAFRLGAPRSTLRRAGFGAADWTAAAVSICIFLAGVYAQF